MGCVGVYTIRLHNFRVYLPVFHQVVSLWGIWQGTFRLCCEFGVYLAVHT